MKDAYIWNWNVNLKSVLRYQMAVAVKWCILEHILVKPKYVWEALDFIHFSKWRKLEEAGGSWRKLEEAGGSWTKLNEAEGSWRKLEEAERSWRKLKETEGSWRKLFHWSWFQWLENNFFYLQLFWYLNSGVAEVVLLTFWGWVSMLVLFWNCENGEQLVEIISFLGKNWYLHIKNI